MKGVIVSGGNKINSEILRKYCNDAYIICCDGGIRNFYELNITPDIVIGDFDSIDEIGRNFIIQNNINVEKYDTRKDFTDTELALNKMIDSKIDEIILLAATGTRMDHTLGNIFYLQKLFGKIDTTLIDNNNIIKYVEEGEYIFSKDELKYLSIIAISDFLTYSIFGTQYDVENLTIASFELRGISNEIVDNTAKIIIQKGRGFVIRSID